MKINTNDSTWKILVQDSCIVFQTDKQIMILKRRIEEGKTISGHSVNSRDLQ